MRGLAGARGKGKKLSIRKVDIGKIVESECIGGSTNK